MEKHVSSGAVIYIMEEGVKKFLIMHRNITDSWHLPKGTQNPGETLEQTAIREINEETGLEVTLGKYLGKMDSEFERGGKTIQKETHYFLAQPKEEKFSLDVHDHEHDEIKFVDYETAYKNLSLNSIYEKEAQILEKALNNLS